MSSGGGTRTHNLSVNSRARLPVELPRIGLPRRRCGASVELYVSAITFREADQSCLCLCVAVGAQQNALGSLGTQAVKRHRCAARVDFAALERRLNVMEMQCPDIARVPAYSALAARLLDQEPLHLSAPTSHGFGATLLAPVVPPPVEPELRLAVVRAPRDQDL